MDKGKSPPCTHCGWAMGEREGEPICNRCDRYKFKKTNISNMRIKFKLRVWAGYYVITSPFGHYLWKDGTIHYNAVDVNGNDNGYWSNKTVAKEFLAEWNNCIETLTLIVKETK